MRKLILITVLITQLLIIPAAAAHRPDSSTDFKLTKIEDSQTSFAFYRELTSETPVQAYQVSLQAGEFFHAGINIPQLVGLSDFGVSMALVGPGLPNENLSADLSAQGVDLDSPALQTILNENSSGLIAESQISEDFYEPFTQTEYWGRQQIDLDAPASGTYYLLIWHPEGEAGKYVLDTGTEEVFGFGDLFRFPNWWWDAQVYFERSDRIIRGLVILVIGLTSGSLITWQIQRKRTQRRIPASESPVLG